MEQLRIRPAAESDIEAISQLLYEVHKVHSNARPDLFPAGGKKYNDGELRSILADDLRPVFVAERDGQVVGHVFCIDKPFAKGRTLYIDDLCVAETARHSQIGRTLYEYVLDYARKKQYYNVTLNVWADNAGAVKFYEKLGLRVQKIGMEQIL